jgi:glycosyltransferase involved in cell wall biosynthesis
MSDKFTLIEKGIKVCFVALGIYPCLNVKSGNERIGGAELQQIFIGKGLLKQGVAVSYVTTDHGQPDLETIDGMLLYKSFREEDGIPGFRYFYPRLFRIWQALKRADADVYYCRAAGFLPGLLVLFCLIYGRKFIYAGAHDTDFLPGKELLRFTRDRFLYHFGLRRASAVIVQSNYQNQLLWANYRLKGTVIRNFFEGEVKSTSPNKQKEILWVSTIRKWKRPFLFIELARAFPDERFVMIGGEDYSNPSLFRDVKEACALLPNIEFLGFQPLVRTESYFDRCKVFVNTSEHEGFPNTFLQAWRRGIPVVSYVNPDGLIKEHGLGLSVESSQQMNEVLMKLLLNPRKNAALISEYFMENHSERVIDKYCSLLKEVVG